MQPGGLTDVGAGSYRDGVLCISLLGDVCHGFSPSKMVSIAFGGDPTLDVAVDDHGRGHAAGPKAPGVQQRHQSVLAGLAGLYAQQVMDPAQ